MVLTLHFLELQSQLRDTLLQLYLVHVDPGYLEVLLLLTLDLESRDIGPILSRTVLPALNSPILPLAGIGTDRSLLNLGYQLTHSGVVVPQIGQLDRVICQLFIQPIHHLRVVSVTKLVFHCLNRGKGRQSLGLVVNSVVLCILQGLKFQSLKRSGLETGLWLVSKQPLPSFVPGPSIQSGHSWFTLLQDQRVTSHLFLLRLSLNKRIEAIGKLKQVARDGPLLLLELILLKLVLPWPLFL